MQFAKRVFRVAGIYGLLVIVPLYFTEAKTGHDFPPAITHPEFYYGFAGVALAWQVLFLILSQDPVRYRLIMLPSILEKISFGIAAIVLLLQHRIPMPIFAGGMVDWVFAVLFTLAYLRTGSQSIH